MRSRLPFDLIRPFSEARTRRQILQVRANSAWGGFRRRSSFGSVRDFCLFIGYPRSGHTLVGSLVDAHPKAVIAHELDVIAFVAAGFGRLQLYDLILRNNRTFAEMGHRWAGYDYAVGGQWQGRYDEMLVLGDKKGGRATLRLQETPALLDRLRATVGVPVRLIHVVRNPYDNIASSHARKGGRDGGEVTPRIKRYFRLCDGVSAIKRRTEPQDILDVRLEELAAAPVATLRVVMDFLGLEPTGEYLAAAATKVFSSPKKSRYSIDWSEGDRARVAEGIETYEHLAGYSFDS